MKNIFPALIITFISFFVSDLQSQFNILNIDTSSANNISLDSINAMNKHFHTMVDEGQIAGIQTAIIRYGKLVHFDTYGHADIEHNIALDEKSIFRIFSMTKPIVSVGIMQLIEKGQLKLRDPLYKYLPEFKEMYTLGDHGEKIKIKQPILIIDLLRHTSGIGYGRGPNDIINQLYNEAQVRNYDTNKSFCEALSKLPLYREPGQNWHYSYSTNICGYLIEVISGLPLDEYLNKYILEPLNMVDTHFQIPESKVKRFTVGYGWSQNDSLTISENASDNRYTRHVSLLNGGGGLVSTTLDYLNFCQMLLNKGSFKGQRILKSETVELMTKDHLDEVRRIQERLQIPHRENGFGLGFDIRLKDTTSTNIIYGWGGAVGTYFRIDPEEDLAYVLMIQLSPYRHLRFRELFDNFVSNTLIK